jgi:hypothetical protein
MYLYPNEAEKVGKFLSTWATSETIRQEIKKFYDQRPYSLCKPDGFLKNKKDDKEFLMQVINPEFDDIISVYHDPRAKKPWIFGDGFSAVGRWCYQILLCKKRR